MKSNKINTKEGFWKSNCFMMYYVPHGEEIPTEQHEFMIPHTDSIEEFQKNINGLGNTILDEIGPDKNHDEFWENWEVWDEGVVESPNVLDYVLPYDNYEERIDEIIEEFLSQNNSIIFREKLIKRVNDLSEGARIERIY